jgi:Ser-tRNA(Ala) deacylase AlaX
VLYDLILNSCNRGRTSNGPYVEYIGSLEDLDKDKIRSDIEIKCNQLIKDGRETMVIFVNRDELKSLCHFIPDYIAFDKPVRLIMFGKEFAVPCGGTHVQNISELKSMSIRKIKMEKGNIRVGYDIAKE